VIDDDEFRRQVVRTLGAIQQEQRDSRREQHFLRQALSVITVLLILLTLTLAVLAIWPGPQLGEL
jgi:hypothetical protein